MKKIKNKGSPGNSQVGLSVYKQNEEGPKGPKCCSEKPESSPAVLGTFLCYLLA